MIIYELDRQPMGSDFQTDWILLEQSMLGGVDFIASSVQIVWEDVTGTIDGALQILASNDGVTPSLVKEIIIDSATNSDDSEIAIVYPAFRFIGLSYIKNGITGGSLSININYEKKGS